MAGFGVIAQMHNDFVIMRSTEQPNAVLAEVRGELSAFVQPQHREIDFSLITLVVEIPIARGYLTGNEVGFRAGSLEWDGQNVRRLVVARATQDPPAAVSERGVETQVGPHPPDSQITITRG